jgi:hypothetical protein
MDADPKSDHRILRPNCWRKFFHDRRPRRHLSERASSARLRAISPRGCGPLGFLITTEARRNPEDLLRNLRHLGRNIRLEPVKIWIRVAKRNQQAKE